MHTSDCKGSDFIDEAQQFGRWLRAELPRCGVAMAVIEDQGYRKSKDWFPSNAQASEHGASCEEGFLRDQNAPREVRFLSRGYEVDPEVGRTNHVGQI